ncbi:cellulose-binding domain-containing protein [Streptomyces radiopugnans]|nr:cellulose-binding domain-containing protein [Streptomyces radiopugnans]
MAAALNGGSPAPGGNCTATYRVTSQWQGGFTAEITVGNDHTAPITGWTVTWTLSGGQSISHMWNGNLTVNGQDVTVRDVGYNGTLDGNGSITFGFQGEGVADTPADVTCTPGLAVRDFGVVGRCPLNV